MADDPALYQQYLQEKQQHDLYQQYLQEKAAHDTPKGAGTATDPASQQHQEAVTPLQMTGVSAASGFLGGISSMADLADMAANPGKSIVNSLSPLLGNQRQPTAGDLARSGFDAVTGVPNSTGIGQGTFAHTAASYLPQAVLGPENAAQNAIQTGLTAGGAGAGRMMGGAPGELVGALGGTGIAQGAIGAKNAYYPDPEIQKYINLNKPGEAAAILNRPRGMGGQEDEITNALKAGEPAFLQANPMGGIDPQAPNSWMDFQKNIENAKTTAKTAKFDAIKDVDNAIASGDANPLRLDANSVNSHVSSLPKEDLAYMTSDTVNGAKQYIQQTFSEPVFSESPLGRQIQSSQPKSMNITDAQNEIGRIDNRLQQIKVFDASAQASGQFNPSVFASNQNEINALGLVKDILKGAMTDTANSAVPGHGDKITQANSVISSMLDYGEAANTRYNQMLGGDAVQAPKSLNTTIGQNIKGLAGQVINGATFGINDDAALARKSAANNTMLPNDLQKLQDISKYRDMSAPLPATAINPQAAASAYQALNNMVQPTYQPPAPPLLSRDFEKVKQDPAQWSQFQQNAFQGLGVDVNKMPDIPQQQAFQQLLQIAPQIATPPATRYQSAITIDGQTKVSGIDKDLAMQKAITIKDPAQRAMQMGGLMKDGTLLPEPEGTNQPAPPAPPPQPSAPLNWLASEEQSNQSAPVQTPNYANDSDNMLAKMKEASGYHVQ